jgi:hypothetical protein
MSKAALETGAKRGGRARGRADYGWPRPCRRSESGDRAPRGRPETGSGRVTLIWLIVWLIANYTGGHEPLLTDPVNVWTWTLILAVGLDLAAAHASRPRKGSSAP